ncbi:MAG: hypothetical protein PVJ34_01290, partial [Anaerolineae bacterium]
NWQLDGETQAPAFGTPPGDAFQAPAIPLALGLFFGGLILLVVLVLWVISTLARGGLIWGAAAADGGQSSSFSQAWRAGWQRGWTLLGIAIVPALPGLLLLLLGGLGFLAYTSNVSTGTGVPVLGNMVLIGGALACLILPLALVLELLRAFANRACMLEGLGVVDAYRRGIGVLTDNLGSALVLFLIQVAVTVVMFILLIVPGAILALCCLFWPLLALLQGAVTAYFSTMWTLAWRRWTAAGETPGA